MNLGALEHIFTVAALPLLLMLGMGHRIPRAEGISKMIEYEVQPTRSAYVSGEEVEMLVRIVSHESGPVQIPDPTVRTNAQPQYQLTGPGWPEGIRFTNGRVLPAGVEPSIENQKLITIPPGGDWTGQISLRPILGRPALGEYVLTSTLAWEHAQAESKPASFRVEPMQITSAHIGLGTRPLESAEGEGAFLQHGASSTLVYTFTFREMRPGIGEATIQTPIQRYTAGPNASDVAVPWRKSPFFNEMVRWIVWREGRAVKAMSTTMVSPVSMDVPADLDRIVLPPLKVTGGPVEVLALSKDQTKLFLIAISGEMGDPGSAKLLWTASLPAHPLGITAALESDQAGSDRHIAFVAEHNGTVEIFHGRYKPEGPAPVFYSVNIATGHPLPCTDPGLFIERDGRARIGVLALAKGGKPTVEFAEAVFRGDAPAGEPTVDRIGELPGKAKQAGLLYADKEGTLTRRDGVIEAEPDKLFKLGEPMKLIPIAPGPPAKRILLAPGKQTTYIICFDSARGLYIEAL